METIYRKHFSNETLILDEKEFVECSITGCQLVHAGGPYHIGPDTKVENCTTRLAGDALNTLRFIREFKINLN